MPFAIRWMGLEDTMLSEINQMEKDKYYLISLLWEYKKLASKINEQPNQTETNLKIQKKKKEQQLPDRKGQEDCKTGKGDQLYSDDGK